MGQPTHETTCDVTCSREPFRHVCKRRFVGHVLFQSDSYERLFAFQALCKAPQLGAVKRRISVSGMKTIKRALSPAKWPPWSFTRSRKVLLVSRKRSRRVHSCTSVGIIYESRRTKNGCKVNVAVTLLIRSEISTIRSSLSECRVIIAVINKPEYLFWSALRGLSQSLMVQ